MNERIVSFSVVRNWHLFQKCLTGNPHFREIEIHFVDNTTENLGIPKRYNDFLDAFDYANPGWIIFCHEDFELRENIRPLLANIPPSAIYGPCGAQKAKLFKLLTTNRLLGAITEAHKDGSNEHTTGEQVPTGTIVDAVDCCAIIVHSSLIKTYHLRFDESLLFDLYSEDFSINAFLSAGIRTRILTFRCCHYSTPIKLPESYIESLKILNRKYKRHCFVGTCGCIGNCLLAKILSSPPIVLLKYFIKRVLHLH